MLYGAQSAGTARGTHSAPYSGVCSHCAVAVEVFGAGHLGRDVARSPRRGPRRGRARRSSRRTRRAPARSCVLRHAVRVEPELARAARRRRSARCPAFVDRLAGVDGELARLGRSGRSDSGPAACTRKRPSSVVELELAHRPARRARAPRAQPRMRAAARPGRRRAGATSSSVPASRRSVVEPMSTSTRAPSSVAMPIAGGHGRLRGPRSPIRRCRGCRARPGRRSRRCGRRAPAGRRRAPRRSAAPSSRAARQRGRSTRAARPGLQGDEGSGSCCVLELGRLRSRGRAAAGGARRHRFNARAHGAADRTRRRRNVPLHAPRTIRAGVGRGRSRQSSRSPSSSGNSTLVKPKRREVAHPHRVERADQVVALVLDDARVKALGLALDAAARSRRSRGSGCAPSAARRRACRAPRGSLPSPLPRRRRAARCVGLISTVSGTGGASG